ncbi:MAG: hypothetical protein M0Q49_02445, partial [Porticoccaceae bacterium]|nr:hypothetical protein [Porticoccaceae bacterium]
MPPRQRNVDDMWMPPRVYRGRSAYEWKPKGGGTIRLCALDASKAAVWVAYEKALSATRTRFDFDKLADMYFASADFSRLKPNTRADYQRCAKLLRQTFGRVSPGSVQPEDVRRYMDLRGRVSTVRANRERSLLSTIMGWGFERGLVKRNPCIGVKTFREKPRDRYVTDAEYQAVLSIAPPMMRAAMEIAYRCAARQQDVLDRQRQHLLDDGLYIKQGKTGKAQVKGWTVELRAAIDLALAQPARLGTMWIIRNRDGQRYTRDGFNSIWSRVLKRALAQGLIAESFTFHDLKAKGISDFEGDKQLFSGHKTRAQMEAYNRKPELVKSIGTATKK